MSVKMGRSRRNLPLPAMKTLSFLTLFTSLVSSSFAADSAKLILREPELKPSSAFEVRFTEPMVSGDAVGKQVESPLVITPSITGKWSWMSDSSGVFMPSEPPPLSTTFKFSLRSGLKNMAGKTVKALFKETAWTPSFGVKGSNSYNSNNTEDASERPTILLLFTAAVKASDGGIHARFEDNKQNKVAATVEQGIPGKGYEHRITRYQSSDRSILTWEEQFAEFRKPATGVKKPVHDVEEAEVDENGAVVVGDMTPQTNLLRVTPVSALPAGEGWRLIVEKAMPSADRKHTMPEPFEFQIGKVIPFGVSEVKPENLLYTGKRLKVTFTKQISKEGKKELTKWISIQPEVPGFKVTVNRDYWDGNGSQVLIEGEFELAKDYTLKFAAGLPGSAGLIFPQDYVRKVSFGPVASRLYFQDINAQQQSSGTRKFHVQNINVSKFKITAKLIKPEAKAAAWIAYRKYHEGIYSVSDMPPDEYFLKVDDALFTGDVVWEEEITNDSPVDKRKVFPFSWDDVLGAGKSGMVLLTVEQVGKQAPNDKRVGAQTLVQVTDLGVAWKSAKDDFLYVFSHTTGEPVGGAKLGCLDGEGKLVEEVKTAADGTARLTKVNDVGWLLVSQEGDQHLVPFGQERRDQEFGRFRISANGSEQDIYDFGGSEGGRRGLMFSDRPVYKPGETVHLKAIVRHGLGQKPLKKAMVVVKDSRSQPVFTARVIIENGAMDVDLPMPADAVGFFSAKLAFEDEEQNDWGGIRHSWRVEEYEPNSFEVKLAMPGDKSVGDKIEVSMSANYYMGKPLSKANFLWSVRAYDDRFIPDGFGAFRFCNALMDYELENIMFGVKTFSQQGEKKLEADGTAILDGTVPPNDTLPQPRRARILVEVTDTDQQTVAQREEFTLHSSDFYLGVNHGEDVVREGDTLPLQIIAVKKDGTALEKQVSVMVKLSHVDWHTNRVEDADDAENYRSEPTILPVAEETLQTLPVVRSRNANMWEADGPATQSEKFKLAKPGMYLITAEAKDDAGRKVTTCTTVYVYGKEETVWNYRNRFQVELVADKPEYHAGDEATIMVKTPIAGKALVTVEREGVRSHFITKLEGNSPTVKIPITKDDAPNVYVSVMLYRGSNDSPKKYKMPEYRLGYARLEIKRPEAELTVSVKPVRTEYRPGEEAEVVCNVQDHTGKPVRDAEVTLWAADEGVLSLTGFEVPNPLATFLEIIRLSVSTGLTLPQLLDEDPETMSFENKGFLVGGFGKGGEPNVRRNFLGTAFWEPTLKTDADGNVRTTFQVPDGLTRYRILAVVQNTKDQFGKAESAFTINKPFMLEPSPPRFGRVGDKVVVRAVLHNTTKQNAEAEVKLHLDVLAKTDEPAKKITLPAGGTATLDFPVELQGIGEAVWTWLGTFTPKDGSAAFTDNVESRIQVTYTTPLLREVLLQRVDAKVTDLLADADPALRDGSGKVRVTVSNSLILELREGVDQLLTYPYGCVEQTTSSLLPWLAMRDFRELLPGMGKTDEEYNQAITKGINRLLKMQTSIGGLSYWPGGAEPMFWGSAYAMTALARAQREGIAISEYDMERLRKYLSDQLRGSETLENTGDLSPYIMACYGLALAGKAEPAYHEMYYKKRLNLSQENRALLALAILESGGSKQMAETLLRIADKKVEEDPWFGSIARAQGVRLMAWSLLSPKSEGTEEIAKVLIEQRTNGHWSTTQGNIWALLGISEYVRQTEKNRKETKGVLYYGEGQAQSFRLSAKGAFQEFEFPLQGRVALNLENSGGRLYTSTKLEVRPSSPVAERIDRGYTVARHYEVVNEDGTLSTLKEPRVGDRVAVTLELSVARNATYLAIEDSLPAVFEAINTNFQSQESSVDYLQKQPWMSHQEIRADRAVFFADYIWKGNHIIRYLARVRAAGTATAPPAKVEEMYHPERFGSSETTRVTTKPME